MLAIFVLHTLATSVRIIHFGELQYSLQFLFSFCLILNEINSDF